MLEIREPSPKVYIPSEINRSLIVPNVGRAALCRLSLLVCLALVMGMR